MSIINPIIGGGATESSGGGANPYVSGNYYDLSIMRSTFAVAANNWYFFPFIVREDVTIDQLYWFRANVAVASVNIGILDKDGLALTDCATDSGTTVETRTVSTTAVNLSKSSSYLWCFNTTATIAAGYFDLNPGNDRVAAVFGNASRLAAGTSFLPTFLSGYASGGYQKSMPAGLVTGNIDLSGMTTQNSIPFGGFRVE